MLLNIVVGLRDLTYVIATLAVPTLLVFRSNLIGVFLGTIMFEVTIIFVDLLQWQLESRMLTPEAYELWYFAWFIGLIYCLFIFCSKFLIEGLCRRISGSS